jgi:uncharacterized protein with PQ loop repeat
MDKIAKDFFEFLILLLVFIPAIIRFFKGSSDKYISTNKVLSNGFAAVLWAIFSFAGYMFTLWISSLVFGRGAMPIFIGVVYCIFVIFYALKNNSLSKS